MKNKKNVNADKEKMKNPNTGKNILINMNQSKIFPKKKLLFIFGG